MFLTQFVFTTALCVLGFGSNCWPPKTYVIDSKPEEGNAIYVTKGSEGPFDGRKISITNKTDFEWWYFEAESKNGDQGVAVWFMTADPANFGLDLPTSNWFIFHARFEDGTGLDSIVPAKEAIVNTIGEGSTGLWTGTGSGWSGTPDLSRFTLQFDVADRGISGIVDVSSIAEAQSALRPARDTEADLMNVGGMGWAISFPAGESLAHVTVGDKTITFSGGGAYHDHNWGSTLPPWRNWYAIRAQVGPYVWTAIESYRGPAQEPFISAHLRTLKGETILATFDVHSLTVRPWGNGSQYPPKGFDPQPLGATIVYDAGDKGKYAFNITNHGIFPGIPIGKGLAKWFGSVEGGKLGEETYQGTGMFEWLDLAI